MKRVARIALIILLMCGTLTTLVFVGRKGLRKNPVNADYSSPSDNKTSHTQLSSNPTLPQNIEFTFSDTEFSLGIGETYQCKATLSDAQYADKLKWSSSDKSTAVVDSNGIITAMSTGEATITAYLSDMVNCSVKVSVYDNTKNSIITNLNALAINGNEKSYNELLTLSNLLEKSKGKDITYSPFLKALMGYGNAGAGQKTNHTKLWETLTSTADKTDLQIALDTLRRAAISAYCHGEKSSSDISLSFTGDCTFGYFNETDMPNMFPDVYRNSGSITYPFDLTKNVFGADDITMINFEGTLTQHTEHKDKQFYFRGEPAYVDILTNSSVEAVSVENNHSFDYFNKGFNETLKHLKNAGIRYTCLTSPSVIKCGNYRVAMLSVALVSTTYKPEFKTMIEGYISQYRRDDTVIVVNLHWGNEGANTPDPWQIEAAHSMIDAGADLIVGHHPHCLQGIEKYKGKYIVYSLGNFSFGGNNSVSSPNTIIFRASFSHNDSGMNPDRVSAVPCHITSTGTKVNNFQPCVRFGENGKATISDLLSLSSKLDGGIKSINWCRVN